MRSKCALLCCLILVLPAAAAAQWTAIPLTNAGFEDWTAGVPDGWELTPGIDPDDCALTGVVADTSDATGGDRALLLRGDAATCRWLSPQLAPLPVAPGEVYRLRGRLKSLDLDPTGRRSRNAQIFALVLDGNGERVAYFGTTPLVGSNDWAPRTAAFQVPPGAASLRVSAFLSVPGALLVDEVALERLDPPSPKDDWSAARRWRSDLDYLVELLTAMHPAPFARLDRGAFLAGIAALEDAGTGTAADIWRLRALLCALGDSHTGCGLPEGTNARLPLFLAIFGDEVRVVGAAPAAAALCGGRVVAVDGRPIADVLAGLRPQIASTHENWFREQAPGWLRMPGALHGLGLCDAADRAGYTVVQDDGSETTVTVALDPGTDPQDWTIAGPAEDAYPLYRRQDRFYWFEYLPDQKTLYLKYDRAQDDPQRPLRRFGADLMTTLDAQPIERFVLDVRDNAGGSNLLRGLFNELARRVGDGRIGRTFVITGRRTYSAAVYDADAMRHLTGAVVFGEATGMAPVHPGEVAAFALPGTGLDFFCSTRMIQASSDTASALMPDVPLEVTWEDFLAGRDPVLEAVLQYEGP